MSITATVPRSVVARSHQVERHFLHRGHGVEFEMECAWVQRHLPPGSGRVADVGCGIGTLFPVLGLSRAIGVDSEPEGLAYTRSRFPTVPLVCADARTLPIADASLDAITLQHLVEHLTNFEVACRSWFRVLRPGGVILILTPNRLFRDPSVYHDDTHVHIFDHKELAQALRGTGFEILDLRTIGLPWFRSYQNIPAGWRLRRLVTRHAGALSAIPAWRWRGQTLCCAARRPRQ